MRSLVLATAVGAVLAFYAWALAPGQALFGRLDGGDCYYNLLIRGFRSGHLSLPIEAPPGLLKLKDPYDPAQNAPFGMHDVSFYRGKFYLYFGAAPAVTLYWPVAAVTGHYLDDRQAIFVFCAAAFLAGAFVLVRARRRYFPELGIAPEALGILVLGLGAMVPVLLRRPQFYEAAISSAYAYFFVALLGLYQSLHARRRAAWLALASLCYGLAIASRPTYAFGAACLLAPVLLPIRVDGGPTGGPMDAAAGGAAAEWRGGRFALLCAAVVPVGLIVCGLLGYNELRFGNPLEFGHQFALSGFNETKSVHFSLSYAWFNCRAYLFAPAHLSAYFPFVRVVSLPPPPPGHYGVEDPYGILPNMPFVALAFCAPCACRRGPLLARFTAGAAIASTTVAVVIFLFGFASNRYMVEFLPGFVLLGVIGFWGAWAHFPGRWEWAVRTICVLLLGWSILFNLFASFGHNELLRLNQPAVFRRLAHAFGYPRLLFDRFTGRAYGPLEMSMKFPPFQHPALEPLLVSGSEFLSDYLYAYYASNDRLTIGFEHTGYGGAKSEPIPFDYTRPHRLRVDMPPLYPPKDDPFFDSIPAEAASALDGRLRVWLDGTEIIDAPQQFYPPFARLPAIGKGGLHQTAFGPRFTGNIRGVRRIEADWRAMARASRSGPLVLSLAFPSGKAGAHEPLVTSGITGRGDILVVNYLDARRVTFSLDHWGFGGPTSGPIEIEPEMRQTLEIRFGSFFPESERPPTIPAPKWSEAAGKLTLILNRRTILETPASFYAASPDTVVVGKNPIGASSCVAEFSGRIFGYIRSDLDRP